ncbi:Hpr(Ser) kinase/phosphatase [Paracoccus aminovorans]|uniref:Hpr(Ser) kinase/phosphatase n=1 Tax=Paracoccus aminovorans TaxID=34004 RepID=A0A1I2XDJ2_9RHOB|nr:HPr kinase/phosphatase C-terminal domain-containing protein [Paracoccus aminovorans]CQR85648.1 HPr kinase [Paracoccus aminovorans]SFH11107.1 Hpr(Ser) kinase/phosphatase [Paracoccus aminovorans]
MILHASCVAHRGRGLLILGASGSGKSALAFQMMAFGAMLVADDRTLLRDEGGRIVADAPEALRGLIEARGIGILRARAHGPVDLALAVDLDRAEPERLPPDRRLDLFDRGLPLVLGAGRVHLASMLLQYLDAGRADTDLHER